MAGSLVVVAIPSENDRVWKVSSEKVPHLTLLFLGEDADEVQNLDQIMLFVEHAANTTLRRFYLPVDRRDELGEGKADVLFFRKDRYDFKAVRDFRATLLRDPNVKKSYDAASQFETPEYVGAAGQPWIPHLTLGYPETPAKPEPDDHVGGFYSVEFNKIAVWAGDYEGPEFLLKDYWEDFDMGEIPMDVAMSEIAHFGVKGMRWGSRKDTTVTVRGKSKQVTARKAARLDRRFERKADTAFFDLHNGAADHVNAHLPALNKRFEDKYPKEMNDGTLHNENHPVTREYHKAYNDLAAEGLNRAAEKLGTNSTGTRRVKIVTTNHESFDDFAWSWQTEKIKHADDDLPEGDVVFVVTLDAQGRIVKMEPQMDSVAQTVDLGEEFLEHFGVKGMKWGVRRAAQKVGSGVKAVGRGVAALGAAMADSQWQQNAYSDTKHEAVHNHVAKSLDNNVLRLQKSPKYRGKNLKTDSDLRKSYYEDVAKVTDSAYRRGVKEVYGENYTGTKTAHYVSDARGPRIEIREKRSGETVAEAPFASMRDIQRRRNDAELNRVLRQAADTEMPDLSINLYLDDNGQVSGVGFVQPSDEEESVAQTADLGADFLAHYGVKGMHWGVRRDRSHPTAVSPQATSVRRGQGGYVRSFAPRRPTTKTRIKVEGGENHPAHTDALKVAEAQAKLRKSGPAALSNQELRDLATRMQLENQVSQLTTGTGRKFVKNFFSSQAQAEVNARISADRQRRINPPKQKGNGS